MSRDASQRKRQASSRSEAESAREPELDIRLGAPVFAADRRRVGSVDRVVLEPSSGRVTHVVVHEGMLLTRDVVVPVESVESASPRRVRLRLRAAELDQLPDFVETAYVPLASKDVPPLITWEGPPDYEPHAVLVPAASLYTPQVMPFAPQLVEERKAIPPDAADLAVGTPVECLDRSVGTIVEVHVDSTDEHVTGVVLQAGARRRLIAVEMLEVTVGDGVRVRLKQCEAERQATDQQDSFH